MFTVSRICGSGFQSIVNAAQMIQLGEAPTVVAGGMENMSQAPTFYGACGHLPIGPTTTGRNGIAQGHGGLFVHQFVGWNVGSFMAQTSDEICKRKGVTREETDEFAPMSMLVQRHRLKQHLRARDCSRGRLWPQG
ncbi:MAG: hypothetical protein Ct9H90mP16_04970 [Candidatus Poseidoniales archaeon]|nr:MAG: hypothetical protein Ct9H90mP16_04970 [Candidatus Poseidoniales archaeon]